MFIKDYRAQGFEACGLSSRCFLEFIPHLQVTPLVLLGGFAILVTRCERLGQNHRIIRLILINDMGRTEEVKPNFRTPPS